MGKNQICTLSFQSIRHLFRYIKVGTIENRFRALQGRGEEPMTGVTLFVAYDPVPVLGPPRVGKSGHRFRSNMTCLNVRFCLKARLDDRRIMPTGALQAFDTRQCPEPTMTGSCLSKDNCDCLNLNYSRTFRRHCRRPRRTPRPIGSYGHPDGRSHPQPHR